MRPRTVFLVVLALVCLCGAVPRLAAAELRALWVDAWSSGLRSPRQVEVMVKFAKEHHFNLIFVQVRRRGDVLYKSALEPRIWDWEGPKDFDALGEAIRLGHAAGLEVHAWIPLYAVGSAKRSSSEPNHVMVRHPEWLCQSKSGEKLHSKRDYYLDPGNLEVQNYLYDLLMEVARDYEIDGIQLDYVRYPSPDWGYNPSALARFNKETSRAGIPEPSDTAWRQWRIQQISGLLKRVRAGLKEARPKARLSASVFSPSREATLNGLQDWPGWLKADLLDFAVPMAFARDEGAWRRRLDDSLAVSKDRVFVGIGAYLLPPEATCAWVEELRKGGGKGLVAYSYKAAAVGIVGSSPWDRICAKVFPESTPLPWSTEPAK